MIRRSAAIGALATLALALGLAGSAGADDREAEATATLDALFPERGTACFARAYDARHLAANPRQTVTFIALYRGYRELTYEEASRAVNPGNTPPGWREASLRVAFRDTGRQRWESRAACDTEPDGRILCSAQDCDSGRFEVKREASGSILITLLDTTVALGGGCGSGEAGRGLGLDNKDDRVFRLAPQPAAQCR